MNIVFNGSDRPTLGVEIEVEVVDEAGALATDTAATKILTELGDEPGYKHELLECTIEVITDVCPTVKEVRRDLGDKLERLVDVADGLGYRILCTGTHPFSSWADQTVSPDPRYHRLIENCQWAARRLLIFGVHTHVGLGSGEEAIAVANSLGTYIPHFLALSSSSPYWMGRDTGLASTRSKIFETLPTAGLPYKMENWGQFQRFMRTLIGAGTIRSIREVWWDIRPHPGSERSSSASATAFRRWKRSARSPRCRSRSSYGWRNATTPASRCRATRRGPSATTSGAPPATVSTPRSSATKRATSCPCAVR